MRILYKGGTGAIRLTSDAAYRMKIERARLFPTIALVKANVARSSGFRA